MYKLVESRHFTKSLRKLKRSGFLSDAVNDDIAYVFDSLKKGQPLPASFADHRLKGEYATYRECHIRGDLLLMYRKNENGRFIVLMDIGTHSQLFG